jgi:hypothetical protein
VVLVCVVKGTTYLSELCRSGYDLGTSASALDDGGIKIRSPSAGAFGEDPRHHKRHTTLLESGMIVECMDVRKAEARIRKEEHHARQASGDSLSAIDNREREHDTTSLYKSFSRGLTDCSFMPQPLFGISACLMWTSDSD